jgi:hypothetical protein
MYEIKKRGLMRFLPALFVAFLALTSVSHANDLPPGFPSQGAADKAGCRHAPVLGPGIDACVLTKFEDQQMDLGVYKKSRNSYGVAQEMVIPAHGWDAHLSFVDALHKGTDWLVIETPGMYGTGISQQIVLILAWDGERFRTVTAETLNYRCQMLASDPEYKLDVHRIVESSGGTPVLHFEYEMLKDDQPVGQWSDFLRWDAAGFAFVPSAAEDAPADSVTAPIRESIRKVREYSATHPLDPIKGDTDAWIRDSGLMEVFAPYCK